LDIQAPDLLIVPVDLVEEKVVYRASCAEIKEAHGCMFSWTHLRIKMAANATLARKMLRTFSSSFVKLQA
jgi:hypothetical protein